MGFSSFTRQSPRGILVYTFLYIYRLIRSSWIFLILVYTRQKDFFSSNYVVFVGVIILLFFVTRAFLVYKNFLFKVDNGNFILKQGVLAKSLTSIPYHKIQNVNLRQNFIQQLINVKEVEIETAGGDSVEVLIRALSIKHAELLKEIILKNKDEIIIEEEKFESSDNELVLQKISPLELLKVSLAENHLNSFMIILAFFYSIYHQLKDILVNFDLDVNLRSLVEKNSNIILGSLLLLLLFFLVAILTSVVVSFFRVFFKYYDLKFVLRKDAIDISQGLFNKINKVLKRDRLQLMKVISNPIKEKFGILTIVFKQVSSVSVSKSNRIQLVGVKHNEKEHFLNILYKELSLSLAKNKPNIYFRNRQLYRSFILLIIFNLFLTLQSNHFLYTMNLILIPVLLIYAFMKYKKSYYSVTEDMLILGEGAVWDTCTIYFKWFKTQKIEFKQTYFQKKRGIGDLKIQTASGFVKIPCIQEKRAIDLKNYVLYKAESSNKNWT